MNRTMWMSTLALFALGCSVEPEGLEEVDGDPLLRNDNALVFPATASVRGQSLSEWNARWWEWLVSIPAGADNPGRGGDCTQNQNDDVFFLASTFGDGPAQRTCTVPAHTPIFIPTVSSIIFGCPDIWGVEDCPWSVEEEIVPYTQELAESRVGLYTYTVTLDGEAIDDLDDYLLDASVAWLDYDGTEPSVLLREQDRYGAGVPPVDVDCARGFDEGNICLFEPGPKAAATLGHAVLLKSLDDGPHTLHVTGSLGTFVVDVTYTLTVD